MAFSMRGPIAFRVPSSAWSYIGAEDELSAVEQLQ
jgi:hypothetical protein